jgi:tetratricopeptide (TPR) repeat protein
LLLKLLRSVRRVERGRADTLRARAVAELRRGDARAGLRLLDDALELEPRRPDLLARKADALLLCGREDDALAAYAAIMPDVAVDLDPAAMPALGAHRIWLRFLSRVGVPDEVASGVPQAVDVRAWSNYASLLANTRRTRSAAALFERVCDADPGDGYAWAARALIHTLNREWRAALPAARRAKELGAELFEASMDSCLLSAALGLGRAPGEVDDYLDWTALRAGEVDAMLARLPPLATPMASVSPQHELVFFVACDPAYLRRFGVALALSIRQHCPTAAVHFHVYSPDESSERVLDWLKTALAPLAIYASQESVDFERFGGVARYCAAARFARLYQWTQRNASRVVMVDADTLVRADLAPALARVGDVGLIFWPHEPMWHALPAFFSVWRDSPASRELLACQAALMVHNLLRRRVRTFMDQVGLYVCREMRPRAAGEIEYLPYTYCDPNFEPASLAWTVTQAKEQAHAFQQLGAAVLASAGLTPELVADPLWPSAG